MNSKLLAILKSLIDAYLIKHGISAGMLANQANVPPNIIWGIVSGQIVNINPHYTHSILCIVDPENASDLMLEYYPFLSIENQFKFRSSANISAHDSALDLAVKSRLFYKVHSMASIACGTTRSEIQSLTGLAGIEALEELLAKKALVETEDGEIRDPFYADNQSNESILCQMIGYNLSDFEPNGLSTGVINIVEGFSEIGLNEIKKFWRKFAYDLKKVIANPVNLGRERMFFSVLAGPVVLSEEGAGQAKLQTQRLSDISFKSAEVLAGVAHDMRAPLSQVLKFLEKQDGGGASTESLQQARNAANRLANMIDSLKGIENQVFVNRKLETFSFRSILNFAAALAEHYEKALVPSL